MRAKRKPPPADEGWWLYDKDKQPADAPDPIGNDGVPLFCNYCGRGWHDVSFLLCGAMDKCICDECCALLKEEAAQNPAQRTADDS